MTGFPRGAQAASALVLLLAACGEPAQPAAQPSTPPAVAPAAAGPRPITLALPIACQVGRDCFVQSYFDRDPGPANRDYRCGAQTYPDHDGLDIRLTSLAAQRRGVAVLAAAPGVVRGVRDGVADVSIRETGREAVANRECGNGVAIVHADGWETQYCHMAQGSIRVRTGETVQAGTPLGRVGLSGMTEFPHVHLAVRRNGEEVDPFAYGAAPGACGGGVSLFAPEAQAALAYREGAVINLGLAGGPVTEAQIDAEATTPPSRTTPLVVFARAINLQAGDVQTLTITGPDGRPLHSRALAPLDRAKASWFAFSGDRPGAGGWPAGRYTARYEVRRGGRVVLQEAAAASVP